MTDISNLCMECLGTKNESGVCTRCGKEEDIIQPSPLLPIKSVIAQRYLIAKAHKQNGECFTYAAYDMKLEKAVSVREFFPGRSAERDIDLINVVPKEGMEKVYSQHLNSFISLWQKIMRLKGVTALITVNDVFQCNGTAYAVYDESERITLRDYLLDTKEGFISWEKARILFMPVLSTLGTLHTSGIIHKGINPSSFIFSKDGKLKLTDFCIEAVRTTTGALDSEIFDGYAAYEQYTINKQLGPWTDIYSFCSVLYRSLIGTTPIDAKTRSQNDRMMIPAKFAEKLPPYVINALINGMAIDSEDRTDNIEQLRNDLSASPRVIGASAPAHSPPVTVEKPASAPQKKPAPPSAPAKRTPTPEERRRAQRLIEQEKQNKKKNAIIVTLFAVLAILLISIAVLVFALVFGNDEPALPAEQTTLGSEIVEVPNFVNGKIDDITGNTTYTDYFEIETVKESSSEVEEGIVISQSIPANTTANKGETITLTVSSGPKTVKMDDVTGLTYKEAEKLLTDKGFVCSKSYYHNDGSNIPETVFETTPAAGELVEEGASVTIIVFTAIEEVTQAPVQDPENGNSVEQFLNDLETSTQPQ